MMVTYRRSRLFDARFLSLGLALVPLSGGCKGLSTARPAAPTRSDRLMQAFPELQSGRFLVIADFEDPAHLEIFRLIGISPEAQCVLNDKRGREDTGSGCLQFTAGSPDDTVVVSNTGTSNWYLKRDWRAYDLLLLSVHAPAKKRRSKEDRDVALELTIAAGPADDRLAVHSSIPLRSGWNVVRLDLAEVGERIPLDDVREMRLSVSGIDRPTELRFDDILLTGHREDLFGDSANRDGGLYVQRVGRRLRIGAGGGFELTFTNGQVVGWYNLAADPYRLRNLVEGTVLGPSPMVLGPPEVLEAGFSALGEAVVARQRIVEMNPVRVVVDCKWWFVDDPDASLDARPFQRWVYTIYPTGQIYVAVEHSAGSEHWSPPRLGLAVTLAAGSDCKHRIHEAGEAESSGDGFRAPSYATVRCGEANSFLLYTLGKPHEFAPVSALAEPLRRHFSLVATPPADGGSVQSWVAHIFLSPADDVSDEEALARVVDHSRAAPIGLELGSFVSANGASGGDLGFDQASGCYVIAPDQGEVRLEIDGRKRPTFSPAFKVLNPGVPDVWVYVNHLIFNAIARDTAGNLLFQLPGTIAEPTVVEVLFRRSQRSDAP